MSGKLNDLQREALSGFFERGVSTEEAVKRVKEVAYFFTDQVPQDWEHEDWEPEDPFDCGAMRDMNNRLVGCSAGSEDCDFDCPYRESVERSLRAQAGWQKRKAAKS